MSFEQNRIRWNGWGPRDDALSESQWRWLAEALAMPALLATPPRALEDIALPPPRLARAVWEQFRIFGDVRQDNLARASHAAGRGLTDLLRLRAGDLSRTPDAVLYPRDEDAVLSVLQLCAALDIAVVPFGGGTSLVGGVTPLRGSHIAIVALDMSAMARLTLVDALSGLAQAQAGISGPELERQLAAHGLMLGHFPGSFEFSTLGGWIAHHGAGQEVARYGRAGDWRAGGWRHPPACWLRADRGPRGSTCGRSHWDRKACSASSPRRPCGCIRSPPRKSIAAICSPISRLGWRRCAKPRAPALPTPCCACRMRPRPASGGHWRGRDDCSISRRG